jgi:hypothetical protein
MNILQIQNRVQELPNTPQTMQYLNAAMNGQVTTVPPYIAAAELKRRETEGMMDQLAKGAAKGPQPTVKDQLEEKAGIMALMGQAQPPQRPQIPQPGAPEQQPQAGGIDNLPVRDDMFGMAGGGIVAFSGGGQGSATGGASGSWGPKPLDAAAQAALQEAQRSGDRNAMLMTLKKLGAAGYDVATLIPRAFMGVAEDVANSRLGRALGVDFKLPASAYGGDRASMTPMMDRVKRAEKAEESAPQAGGAGTPDVPSAKGRLSPDDMALRQQPASEPASGRPPGARPPATAKPSTAASAAPTAPGINLADQAPGMNLADQAPGMNLADALEASPELKKLRAMANAANPYDKPQESQADYIKRRQEGILSQIPGGKAPWETSEARLREIEDRRRKEDADYEAMTKGEGRRVDNLLTLISNMGAGSFGQAGSRGVRALQQVEREQASEALKRKDMRDQQSMKLMEIRALNDQAQFAEATGNVKEYERLQQEIKKLKSEYDLKQGDIAKGVMEAGAGARAKDVEDKRAREKTIEESRQKGLDRESAERISRIGAASRAEARAAGADEKTVQMAESAFARDPEAQAIKKRLESSVNPAKRQTDLERLREIQVEKYRQFGIKLEGAPSPAPADGGNTQQWGKASIVKP